MAERPKRRKHKDNPYTLYCEENGIYIIEFRDSKGVKQRVKVKKDIYLTFDSFELKDLKELNEYDRHIEHSEIYENNLTEKLIEKELLVEEQVENAIINEELIKAINKLSIIQKRRIIMFYFDELTQREIAEIEHTSIRAVQYTLNSAVNELKEIMKNFKN